MKKFIKLWTSYLYLYQIEEYNLSLFARHTLTDIMRLKLKSYEKKDRLVFTSKIKLLLSLTLLIQALLIILSIVLSITISSLFILILFPTFFLTPLIILIAATLILPIELYIKKRVIRKAEEKVKRINGLKIISITGCYGKTSTIAYLKTLLTPDLKVFTPHYGYNTILGISSEIIKHMPEDTEILILELGDYVRGEIEEMCKSFPPDISVITSIGSQHLERFKTMENLILSKTEIITNAKQTATIILPPYVFDMPLVPKDTSKTYIQVDSKITDMKDGKLYFETEYETYHTLLLGQHMVEDLAIGIKIAKLLGSTRIQAKINIIKPVKRRMSPFTQNGVEYIDDTYNIGIESANEAIKFLEFLKDKNISNNLVVITGGIVEQGANSEKANADYAKLLNQKVDKIILFDTPFTKQMEIAIDKTKTIFTNSYEKFWEDLALDIPKGSIVLMQNDVPDAYYIN